MSEPTIFYIIINGNKPTKVQSIMDNRFRNRTSNGSKIRNIFGAFAVY